MDSQGDDGAQSKYAWLPRYALVFVIALFVCTAVIAGVALFKHSSAGSKTLRVDGRQFSLQVADTSSEQATGLANRTSLPINQGMLFVYKSPQRVCMWMNNMPFPIDMIWLDASKKVVYVQQNATPNTLPDTFCPTELAQYVVEFNAGTVAATDMRVGQTLSF